MILTIVLTTIVVVGLAAIALAEPRQRYEPIVWSDDAERRLLHERKNDRGWW